MSSVQELLAHTIWCRTFKGRHWVFKGDIISLQVQCLMILHSILRSCTRLISTQTRSLVVKLPKDYNYSWSSKVPDWCCAAQELSTRIYASVSTSLVQLGSKNLKICDWICTWTHDHELFVTCLLNIVYILFVVCPEQALLLLQQGIIHWSRATERFAVTSVQAHHSSWKKKSRICCCCCCRFRDLFGSCNKVPAEICLFVLFVEIIWRIWRRRRRRRRRSCREETCSSVSVHFDPSECH
jgi:hypothetical protein